MRAKIPFFLLLTFFVGCALLSCGKSNDEPLPSPFPMIVPTGGVVTVGEGMSSCPDPLGCVVVAPYSSIRIAYILALTGNSQTQGVDSRNGIAVAVALKNQIKGHPIELVGEDDGCNEEGGRAAGERIASDPTIIAIVGTTCSKSALAAMSLVSKAGMTMVSPSNVAVALTEAGNVSNYPGYFRTAPNNVAQAVAVAQYAFTWMGIRKAAIMYDGSGDSTGMQSVFANVFQSLGGTVTTIEPIDAQGVDFSAPLTKIAATGAELLYVPIRLQALSVVMRQARTTPGLENAAIVGSAEAFSPKAQETLGDAIEGFLVTRPDLSAYSPDYFSVFIPKYEELFGGSPNGFFHAYAFDAANLIFAAIEKVAIQDSSGTLTIGRQALRDAMYATKDFQGLTGVLTCTPAGDCANPVVIVYQYHIGQYPPTRVWP